MSEHLIVCRAKVSDDCYHGTPTRRQFGQDLPMDEDGTCVLADDGTESIVCDACFVLLTPFTPSGNARMDELDAATVHVREQLAMVREHPDPAGLAAEARTRAGDVSQGTPAWSSALACARLADAEVARRAAGGGRPPSRPHPLDELRLCRGIPRPDSF